MELSKRLQMNVDLVPSGTGVGDIGCDHGYGSIYLAKNRRYKKVVAMDVNPGPLQIAKKNIERAGLSEVIECRLSDGLQKLHPGEVDILMIAGMGGMLICRILKEYPVVLEQVGTLVLQPQSDLAEVRKCVHALGYRIDMESVCVDAGKYYFSIRAVRGDEEDTYTEKEYRYGRLLIKEKNEVYREYLSQEKRKKEHIRQQLTCKQTQNAKERALAISHILDEIDEILKEL